MISTMPLGLTERGVTAYRAVVDFAKEEGLEIPRHTFVSPREWNERGEQYGLDSDLIVIHDGGDLAGAFNLDHEQYNLFDSLAQHLNSRFMYANGCTCWYSAIYLDDEKI